MIILVENRIEVVEAYRTTMGREGVSAMAISAEEFGAWFSCADDQDLASVEAVVLGEVERRENLLLQIKSKADMPVIVLADIGALETTLKLFQAGADDVIRKPVHAKEILARVNAVRRRTLNESQALWNADGLVVFGDGRDPTANGSPLHLPRRERRILDYLAASKSRRVTRSQLFSAIYGMLEEGIEECVIETHISKLRKKLRTSLSYDPIDTQRYLGYQFVGRQAIAA